MRYRRLVDRWKECNDKYFETLDSQYSSELHCLDHVLGSSTLERYNIIKDYAETKGVDKLYDIGCAYGHQSEVFLNSNIEYVGINDGTYKKDDYWNSNVFKYIQKEYPFRISTGCKDMAVSVLCLTWDCYLYEGDKTLTEQCEALQRDFKHVILHVPEDKIDHVSKYFKTKYYINEELVYFSN